MKTYIEGSINHKQQEQMLDVVDKRTPILTQHTFKAPSLGYALKGNMNLQHSRFVNHCSFLPKNELQNHK